MQQAFYKGQWKSIEDLTIPISNRSFRYGDGLFESFRWLGKKWAFENQHWDRLSLGAEQLKHIIPDNFKAQIINALNQRPSPHACRLTLWRAGTGKYTPASNDIEWLLEADPIPNNLFSLNPAGLIIDIGETLFTPNSLSAYKTNNALEYIMASLEKQERGLDDLILCNCYGELVEACHSNLFLVMENEILTPPLTSGCLNGSIRKALLQMPNARSAIIEKTHFPHDLQSAREIWLTNSLSGIRWVKRCGNLKFGHQLASEFLPQLNKLAIL